MGCSECENLRRELEEQKAQVVRYEGKIRDTVNAYKMLESQKQSLEVALSVLSVKIPGNAEEEAMPEKEVIDRAMKKTEGMDAEESEKQQPDQLESLKQAITTLTLVNKRKEMEFKRDRRALVDAKDEMQRRCEQLEQQLQEKKQQNKSQNLRRLREQLAESQAAQERAMTEHGMMLAELQQQYGKEKRNSESLGKQITEMSQRLAVKDDLLKRAEMQLKEMSRLEQEVESLRRKAEMTPTARLFRDELVNVKAGSEQEVSALRSRYAMQSAQLRERDARIEQLEQRMHKMSERSAEAEQRNIELAGNVAKLEKELLAERSKTEQLAKIDMAQQRQNVERKTTGELIDQFQSIYQQLRTQQADFDVFATLGLENQRPPSRCSDGTGPISLSITSSVTPAQPLSSQSRNASSVSLAFAAVNDMDEPNANSATCNSCNASRRELDYFKSLIGHLQRKLGVLEENHERTKKEHENSAELLRGRIVELETNQHRQFAQLTAEAKQRVVELEEELQRQRSRMLEIVAEKDREIELTKNSLANFYARNYGGSFAEERQESPQQNLPMDPAQPRTGSTTPPESPAPPVFQMRRATTENHGKPLGKRSGTEGASKRKDSFSSIIDQRRSSVDEQSIMQGQPIDFAASYQSSVSAAPVRRSVSRSSTLHYGSQFGGDGTMLAGAAARNIFYEQELCKREQEIGELRNVIRLLELKVRDIEQAMLLKDVQYLQIIETLKEEIRVLEGRLTLASSQTNLAYLRNIFVQFLNQNSASGRKHILKAIGAVLQLTAAEMQRVDRWSH